MTHIDRNRLLTIYTFRTFLFASDIPDIKRLLSTDVYNELLTHEDVVRLNITLLEVEECLEFIYKTGMLVKTNVNDEPIGFWLVRGEDFNKQ